MNTKLLPKDAAKKFRDLKAAHRAERLAGDTRSAALQQIQLEIGEAESNVRRLERLHEAGQLTTLRREHRSNGTVEHIEPAPQVLEEARAELAEIKERKAELIGTKVVCTWRPLVEDVESWINKQNLNGKKLQDFTPEVPEGDVYASLLDVRQQVDSLKQERKAVKNAGLPFEQALAQVERDVDQLARKGAPDFSPTLRLKTEISGRQLQGHTVFPTEYIQAGAQRVTDGAALICWLFKDNIIERAKVDLRKRMTSPGLTTEERRTRLREIDAEILELERVEEALYLRAKQLPGHADLARRAVSFEAFLGVRAQLP